MKPAELQEIRRISIRTECGGLAKSAQRVEFVFVLMKKKVVRLGKLNRLYVRNKQPNQGVGPCALELSAVLNCWSNTRDGAPDASECKALVEGLTNCMRTFVLFLLALPFLSISN
jgi:hypothetical protein